MAKSIPITAEYVRSRINYDPDTGVLRWKSKIERNRIDRMWNTRFAGLEITHRNSSGHIQFGLDGKNYLAHRIAWLIVHGEWVPLVDHENRIRDDNRLSNLRAATRSQNNSNTRHYSNNTIGFRGVWRNGNRWAATIRYNHKQKYLGNYETPEKAAQAYDAAARQLHGAFATLNFP